MAKLLESGVTISIHASRGGSDNAAPEIDVLGKISIHASRGGSDLHNLPRNNMEAISIHASRGGSDVPPAGSAA